MLPAYHKGSATLIGTSSQYGSANNDPYRFTIVFWLLMNMVLHVNMSISTVRAPQSDDFYTIWRNCGKRRCVGGVNDIARYK